MEMSEKRMRVRCVSCGRIQEWTSGQPRTIRCDCGCPKLEVADEDIPKLSIKCPLCGKVRVDVAPGAPFEYICHEGRVGIPFFMSRVISKRLQEEPEESLDGAEEDGEVVEDAPTEEEPKPKKQPLSGYERRRRRRRMMTQK